MGLPLGRASSKAVVSAEVMERSSPSFLSLICIFWTCARKAFMPPSGSKPTGKGSRSRTAPRAIATVPPVLAASPPGFLRICHPAMVSEDLVDEVVDVSRLLAVLSTRLFAAAAA